MKTKGENMKPDTEKQKKIRETIEIAATELGEGPDVHKSLKSVSGEELQAMIETLLPLAISPEYGKVRLKSEMEEDVAYLQIAERNCSVPITKYRIRRTIESIVELMESLN